MSTAPSAPHRSAPIAWLPLAATLLLFLSAAPLHGQDASQAVEDGGIFVAGWEGRIDAAEAGRGYALDDARLAAEGDALRVTTGPSGNYWKETAYGTGQYTVSAEFTEHEYMALNNHPHPYGIFIAGNGLGTPDERLVYCSAYGNGTFIFRGFGPEPFRLNGDRPEPHSAINQAAGQGEPVTQHIAMTVGDGTVSCAINGTVVAEYELSEVVREGQLATTDGVWGVRFGHNTDATVVGLEGPMR
jgi:hypothetical protein